MPSYPTVPTTAAAAAANMTLTEKFAQNLVGSNYLRQGAEAIRRNEKLVELLLTERRLPIDGWDPSTMRWWLDELALMDSNNFLGNVGAGEREGRVVNEMIRSRHFGFAHGIGRSGDVAAVQPKAAGSSVIVKVTACLVKDLIRRVCGIHRLNGVLVLPVATGMALMLVLLTLRPRRPPTARYVVWTRIDQKTCFKAIRSAGLEPVVVENQLVGDCVCTDLEALKRAVESLPDGIDSVLCIASTTSCFAPRVPDDVVSIAELAKTWSIPHVINNAYGLSCSKICHAINESLRVGRVDAVVQSTDKNLMVPVGGSIVASHDAHFAEVEVSQTYPGRASMSPLLDVFITLLTQGERGFRDVFKQRRTLSKRFETELSLLASKHGERLLGTFMKNTISFAITLDGYSAVVPDSVSVPVHAMLSPAGGDGLTAGNSGGDRINDDCDVADTCFDGGVSAAKLHSHEHSTLNELVEASSTTQEGRVEVRMTDGPTTAKSNKSSCSSGSVAALGSMVFTRGVSGARVVARGQDTQVSGTTFHGYGASYNSYPHDYITVACAVGLQDHEFDLMISKLDKVFRKKLSRLHTK